MQVQTRKLNSAGVARTLGKAGIPALGANKLLQLSPKGNTFVREDGTIIRIFNVLAFRSKTEQLQASASWKEGTRLEKAGQIDEAQEHFKAALNKLMSFSTLENKASDFEGNFEVNCVIAEVPAGDDLQAEGIHTVLGIQTPRAVAVTSNISGASSEMFTYVEPSTTAAKKKAKAGN